MFWRFFSQVQDLKAEVSDMGFKPFTPNRTLHVLHSCSTVGHCTGVEFVVRLCLNLSYELMWFLHICSSCRSFWATSQGFIFQRKLFHMQLLIQYRRWIQDLPTSSSWNRTLIHYYVLLKLYGNLQWTVSIFEKRMKTI